MSSEPAHILVHGLLLAAWAAVGVLATLGRPHPAILVGVGAFWLWFVEFAALLRPSRVTELIGEHDPLKPAIRGAGCPHFPVPAGAGDGSPRDRATVS